MRTALILGRFWPSDIIDCQQALQPATAGIYSFVGAWYADWRRRRAFASLFVTLDPGAVPSAAVPDRRPPDCGSVAIGTEDGTRESCFITL
jgi:hypothetical protein